MTKRSGLDGVKGGDLLRMLRDALSPPAPASKLPEPASAPKGLKEELAHAFAQKRHLASPGANGPKPPKAPKKEVLHVPPGMKATILAAVASTVRPAPENAKAEHRITDFGEAAFKRMEALRTKLDVFVATHSAPLEVTAEARAVVQRRIALGARQVAKILDPHNGYFIGYDFGTSTTKAVLRDPYRGAGHAFAVRLPDGWGSGGQPHLWPTALWYHRERGGFSAVPEPGWWCLSDFKSAVMESRGHRTCCGAPVTMKEAAAAFLALHVAYVIGATVERDPFAKVAGINVGVPVASLADQRIGSAFRQIVGAGLSLIPYANELTIECVRSAFTGGDPLLPFEMFTELSGAIAGYCTAPRHYRGAHMIIDCGSATLDMASFTLGNPQWPIGIYCARVERLGADACQTYLAGGATEEDCRGASRFVEFDVYRDTRPRSSGFLQDRNKYPYQVILIGGGIRSSVHKPMLDRMEAAFHRRFHRPTLAADLDLQKGAEPGRLILADGLARAPIDLREVAMPGDRPPPVPPPYPEMITKDQV